MDRGLEETGAEEPCNGSKLVMTKFTRKPVRSTCTTSGYPSQCLLKVSECREAAKIRLYFILLKTLQFLNPDLPQDFIGIRCPASMSWKKSIHTSRADKLLPVHS